MKEDNQSSEDSFSKSLQAILLHYTPEYATDYNQIDYFK